MRPTKLAWAMELARVVATRGTCHRRQVGCVLLNGRGQLMATGYNGRAAGLPHCAEHLEHRCTGAGAASGTRLEACEAVHAEMNALLQCRDVYQLRTCVVTVSPCITCVKLLLNTSVQEIVFRQWYPGEGLTLWEQAGRGWIHLGEAGQELEQFAQQKLYKEF